MLRFLTANRLPSEKQLGLDFFVFWCHPTQKNTSPWDFRIHNMVIVTTANLSKLWNFHKFSIGYRNITTLLYRLNFWSLLQTHHGPWSIFRCLFCGNGSFGVTILQSYRSHRMVSSGMEAIALKKWVDQMTSKSVWKTKGWNAGKFKQLSEHPDKKGPSVGLGWR